MKKRRKVIISGFDNKYWKEFNPSKVELILERYSSLSESSKPRFLEDLENFIYFNINRFPDYEEWYKKNQEILAAVRARGAMYFGVDQINGVTAKSISEYFDLITSDAISNFKFPIFRGIEFNEIDSAIEAYLRIIKKEFVKDNILMITLLKQKGHNNNRLLNLFEDESNIGKESGLREYYFDQKIIRAKEREHSITYEISQLKIGNFTSPVLSFSQFPSTNIGDGDLGSPGVVDLLDVVNFSYQDKNGVIINIDELYIRNNGEDGYPYILPGRYYTWENKKEFASPSNVEPWFNTDGQNVLDHYNTLESINLITRFNLIYYYHANYLYINNQSNPIHFLDFIKSNHHLYKDVLVIDTNNSTHNVFDGTTEKQLGKYPSNVELRQIFESAHLIERNTGKYNIKTFVRFDNLSDFFMFRKLWDGAEPIPRNTDYYNAQLLSDGRIGTFLNVLSWF